MPNLGEMDGRMETGTVMSGTVLRNRLCRRVEGGWRQCNTIGERVDGISMTGGPSGTEDVVFSVGGIQQVTSGAALDDAAEVVTDASGRAIPLPLEAGTYYVAGLCEGAVSAINLVTTVRHNGAAVQRTVTE